jgi:hypothetical protein
MYYHAQCFFLVEKGNPVIFGGKGKLGWPELQSASYVSGMTGICHHTQLLVEMGSRRLFAQAGLDLPSS